MCLCNPNLKGKFVILIRAHFIIYSNKELYFKNRRVVMIVENR